MNQQSLTNLPALRASAAVTRAVRVGGISKQQLLDRLAQANVQLNDHARVLFDDARFTTSSGVTIVQVVELAVADLGFDDNGATIAQIQELAAACGFASCPLELAPHLRLQYADQPEGFVGHTQTEHRAPPGSLTVACDAIAPDDEGVPKGSYLRRIEGTLWLRGYRSGPDHVWSASDRFAFRVGRESDG